MKLSLKAAAAVIASIPLVSAQTWTDCNPTKQSCPADPALGGHADFDFTQGPSDRFSAVGSPSYDGNGAAFTVAKSGDAPTITSRFYIMFGHVEWVIKAAPGTGIVSSAVLQSDALDEIDWEWLGGNNEQVQSNYFAKGDTSSYDRGAFHANPGNHDGFHTYSIDWTSSQIEWKIDGQSVRTLTPETSNNQYPQTPMMIKVGSWAGGDPGNPEGTIQWAGGLTDYSAGPFTMLLKSIAVTDYSTGQEYRYTDQSGTWQSIEAVGGKVNGNGSPGKGPQVASSAPPAEATREVPTQGIIPPAPTSTVSRPSEYPWIPRPSTTEQSDGSPVTEYTGLPTDWIVTESDTSSSPNSASETSPSTSSPSPSAPASTSSARGPESGNSTVTRPSGSQGTFITTTTSASETGVPEAPETGAASSNTRIHYGIAVVCGLIGAAALA
ncbi:hypothetical protein AJ80_06502 [Polytolypa hystricis UAMH7299]|uniref:Crh-like protein n=1 Tax=Polytolypa hystricis (strain UAMH7299) TaxID=1447883 RepID=A0A2B7XWT7_POLH7|nr:hypothetical protein AJ80_06502 [Polytolypa hystricis UAMH7299]